SNGFGGCSYCSDEGSGDFAGDVHDSLKVQFELVKQQLHKKWHDAKYIAYFQAHTNTYAPLSVLQNLFEEVLTYENVVGLSIATRADCLEDDVVEYLYNLSCRTYLIVELGLQTIHDETANKINRCHSYADFLNGYNKLKSRGINVCVHIINGLPGETRQMMVKTGLEVGKLNPHCVKIHLLHVLKNTVIANQLQNNEFSLLSLDEYINIVCDQLEVLPQSVIIQRVTGDADPQKLIGPLWSMKKFVVMNEIDKELARRKSFQGKLI
ncbi:MAG: TIGR01212 family radical SAM protein, partial [Oscillospiraceae bacterium]